MISIFTISRQYGSGGSMFAKVLAKKTGFSLVWREIINQAALEIGAPDVALAMIDEFELLGLSPDEKTCSAYCEAVEKIILAYAAEGKCILVGRASHHILAGFRNVLRIRVIASEATRIENICQSKNVSATAAAAQMEQSDRYRSAYLEKFYHADWNDPKNFDLIINSDKINLEQAADWLVKMAAE